LLKNTDFVFDACFAELVDAHACVYHAWITYGTEEVAMGGDDYAVFLGLWMERSSTTVLDQVIIDD
jgi:hypothetical protein